MRAAELSCPVIIEWDRQPVVFTATHVSLINGMLLPKWKNPPACFGSPNRSNG